MVGLRPILPLANFGYSRTLCETLKNDTKGDQTFNSLHMATLEGSLNPVCIDVAQAAQKIDLLDQMGYMPDATLVMFSTGKDGLTAKGVEDQLREEFGKRVVVEAFGLPDGGGASKVEIVIRKAA